MTVDAYPLAWPLGRPRTPTWKAERAAFTVSFAVARDEIVMEVARLIHGNTRWRRGDDVIISTNIPLRRDGLPLANQRQPTDAGVAIYFKYKGKQRCFACDRWKLVEHNMRAIAKTIEALRGIARWGTGDMLDAAFTGFEALPAPAAARGWREVLGVEPVGGNLAAVRERYRVLAAQHHPDRGGSHAKMAEINAAWEQAQRALA